MTSTITITTYSFDELSESAKNTARDGHRYADVECGDWWDAVYEDAVRMAALLGITIGMRQRRTMNNETIEYIGIYFSGFCSQGDGACYAGTYTYEKDALAKIQAEAPEDKELARIATELTALQVALVLTHSGSGTTEAVIKHGTSNYSHSHTMEFDVCVSGDDSDDCYDPATWPQTEEALCQLLRDFANWIYKQLEAEHDYLTSDERVDERLADLTFDEDGRTI